MPIVQARALGRAKPLVPDFEVPLPPEFGGGGRVTLRDLIACIVRWEVLASAARREDRKLVRVLSPAAIAEGEQRGRIDSGGHEVGPPADEDAAVGAALQAFEDGVYLTFIDGDQQRDLGHEVHVLPDSNILFVRLVMLAGG